MTEAFASPSLDSASSWKLSEQLAALPIYYELKDKGVTDFSEPADALSGTYLENFRQIFDLYTGDSAADVTHLADGGYDAEQELGSGQAVFWLGGDQDYGISFRSISASMMQMKGSASIPIITGLSMRRRGRGKFRPH